MGWIEFLLFLLILLGLWLIIAANGALGDVARSAARMRHVAHRREMLAAEQARYAESKRTVNLASQTAESAVEAIATVTQAGHSVITATAFGTLEQFGLTKAPAKMVRGVHDSIVDNVYDSITALNKGIGSAIRRTQGGPGAQPHRDSGGSSGSGGE